MAEKTLEMLQEQHADMLAQAIDLGMEVPQDLVPEFSTREVGEATCQSLDKLLAEFRRGLDDGGSEDVDAAATKKAPKRKRSGGKSKKSESDTNSGETAAEEKEKSDMPTATAKKATAKKKAPAKSKAPAKKAAAAAKSKKAATHKARDGMVRRRDGTERHVGIGHIKLDEGQKVQIVVKDPPDLKKSTKWAARLKKVYAHAGKKVGDFAGSKSDIKWAINFGLIKVS